MIRWNKVAREILIRRILKKVFRGEGKFASPGALGEGRNKKRDPIV